MERRNFLVLVGADLLLPVANWRLNPGPWLAYSEKGKQVSSSLVDEIERLISARLRMDDELGGGALLDTLGADLRFVTEILKNGTYRENIGTRLHKAAAQIARLAGWAAVDSARHAAAQQYFLAALRSAEAVGDHSMAVNVVGMLGMQAYETGHATEATGLLDMATAQAQRTPAVVQAVTWARTGRAFASAGASTRARESLDRSAELLGRAVEGDTPTWLYWFNETRLRSQIGRALFDLGDHVGAENELTAAYQGFGESTLATERDCWRASRPASFVPAIWRRRATPAAVRSICFPVR